MKALGYQAFLIGERFMIEPDPGAALAGLIESLEGALPAVAWRRWAMTAVKICGITRREDAEPAAALGAVVLGFVLWPNSPRASRSTVVRSIVATLPDVVTPVGVFVESDGRRSQRGRPMPAFGWRRFTAIRPAGIGGRSPMSESSAPCIWPMDAPSGIEPDVPDDLVLLDAHDPVRHGGTGKTVDWTRARADRARRGASFLPAA